MSTPLLTIETIAFHGHEASAVPLQAEGTQVTVPEFVRDGRSLPVALVAAALDGHISIEVTLFCQELAGQTVQVHASRSDGSGHAVQAVAHRPVTFDNAGHSGRLQFSVAMLPAGVDLDRVSWQWKFAHAGQVHPANVTHHDIAVILETPHSPWTTGTPTGHTALPMWEVLKHACTHARGARTPREAATLITRAVFNVWGATYYKWDQSAETFASDAGDPLAFDCARFLNLIGGPPPASRELVDCSDIATILSTFASILGCRIQQVVLNNGLLCRAMKLVGHDEWSARDFPLHEIAVGVPLESDPEVWDGCLLVSGDQVIGQGEPENPLLPAGLGGAEYLDRLLHTERKPFSEHVIIDPLSRPLGPLSNLVPTRRLPTHLEPVLVDFELQAGQVPGERVVRSFEPMTVAGDGWSVVLETPLPSLETVDAETDAVARMVCTWASDPRRRVRLTLYFCSSAAAARRRLQYLLGKFPSELGRIDGADGIAHATSDRKTIVGAIMNVAYRIVDAGETPVEATDALRLKSDLTRRLASASQPL